MELKAAIPLILIIPLINKENTMATKPTEMAFTSNNPNSEFLTAEKQIANMIAKNRNGEGLPKP